MMGRADDAVKCMQKYRINLATLRFGAGLKGKVFDGFLSGTPTVATPIAIEGIFGGMYWGCPISADPTKIAKAAVDLYQSESKWKVTQKQGQEIANARFSANDWQPKLPKMLKEAIKNRDENRHQHFYGRLLRHHNQRSTEFMSRWVEEKNKSESA